jgi:hypothetical protein
MGFGMPHANTLSYIHQLPGCRKIEGTGTRREIGIVRKRTHSSVTHGRRYGGERIGWVSGLEFCAGDAALSDDRKECAGGELWMVRNWDCDCPCVGSTLHHHMTAASPDLAKAVFFKGPAGISTGKNSQFTHAPLRNV